MPLCPFCQAGHPPEAKQCSSCQAPFHELSLAPDGDFEAAIRHAADGTVFRLAAAEYRLTREVNVDRHLAFIGAGMDKTRIVLPESYWGFDGAGQKPVYLVLADLTLEHPWAEGDAIKVRGGRVRLKGCRLKGSFDGTKGPSTTGLLLEEDTCGDVQGCEIEGFGESGISAYDSSFLVVSGCVVRNNGENGIDFSGQATGQVTGNTCTGNGWSGIWVSDQASVKLAENTCNENHNNGIHFGQQATGVVSDNTCRSNGWHGLAMYDAAAPVLLRNRLTHNQRKDIGDLRGECAQRTVVATVVQSDAHGGLRGLIRRVFSGL